MIINENISFITLTQPVNYQDMTISVTVATVSLMQTPGQVTRCHTSDVSNNVIVREPERRCHKRSELCDDLEVHTINCYPTSHD